jgi:hypothetical protein
MVGEAVRTSRTEPNLDGKGRGPISHDYGSSGEGGEGIAAWEFPLSSYPWPGWVNKSISCSVPDSLFGGNPNSREPEA